MLPPVDLELTPDGFVWCIGSVVPAATLRALFGGGAVGVAIVGGVVLVASLLGYFVGENPWMHSLTALPVLTAMLGRLTRGAAPEGKIELRLRGQRLALWIDGRLAREAHLSEVSFEERRILLRGQAVTPNCSASELQWVHQQIESLTVGPKGSERDVPDVLRRASRKGVVT